MNAKEFLAILHTAERLKDTLRHCTTSRGRAESVAEHSWRTALMALLLKDEFPQLDIDKVVSMCLIHDLGECFTGDIPTFVKTDVDRANEDDLLACWVSSLPGGVSENLAALYEEMDAQITPEAKLYKALDKLEALIQHNESPIGTWSENEYELNRNYAFGAVGFSEWLTELRKEILSDTVEKIRREAKEATVCIRRVRAGDEKSLAYIQTESWRSAFRHILTADELDKYADPARAEKMYARLLAENKGNGYILTLDGLPHAIAWWDAARDAEYAGKAELICIHSLPAGRRKGYGRRLMEKALSDIREAGFAEVVLWTFAANADAIAFYEKEGFAPEGGRRTALGRDEVCFIKKL